MTLRIAIRAITPNGSTTLLRWALSCSPPAHDLLRPAANRRPPDPGTACAALRDYARRQSSRLPQSTATVCDCPGVPVGTPFALVRGTLDGKRIDVKLTSCMCGFSGRLIRDLQTATGISGRPG